MQSHGGSQPGRSRGRRSAPSANVTTLALEEYWGTSSGSAVSYFRFLPGASKLSRLDALGSIYEQYRVRSLSVRLAPIVGMNESGSIIAGFFYDYTRQPSDYSMIAMCSPHVSGPVWATLNLTVPTGVLMRQQWYTTHQAGSDVADSVTGGLAVTTDGGTKGTSVWVRYVVDFQGPTLKPAKEDVLFAYNSRTRRWTDETGETVTEIKQQSGSFSIDLEVADEQQGVLDQIWQSLQSAFIQAHRLHNIAVQGLRYARYVTAGLNNLLLPALTANAVLHVHPDPFRLAIRLSSVGRGGEVDGGTRPCTGDDHRSPAGKSPVTGPAGISSTGHGTSIGPAWLRSGTTGRESEGSDWSEVEIGPAE